MCGIETQIKTRETRAIFKQIVKYLDENVDIIIDNILSLLEKNLEKSYIDELEEKKANFKRSIQGDFHWMRDYAETPNKKIVNINDEKYQGIYIESSLHLAYCDFYKEFSNYIKTIKKSKAVEERLEKFSLALQKKYKCR